MGVEEQEGQVGVPTSRSTASSSSGTDRLDWVNSPGSINEVGSIHTIQGYDLNYAGVIIGPGPPVRPDRGRLVFDGRHYFDTKGVENNKPLRDHLHRRGHPPIRSGDIYAVLLTRGMLGTYVYVCDEACVNTFDSISSAQSVASADKRIA